MTLQVKILCISNFFIYINNNNYNVIHKKMNNKVLKIHKLV